MQLVSKLERLQAQSSASLQPLLARLQSLYDQRLWHQLSSQLLLVASEPSAAPILPELYTDFISSFANHLDPLDLVRIATAVAMQYTEPDLAIGFLDSVADVVDKPHSQHACVLAKMEAAQWRLLSGRLEETLAALNYCESALGKCDRTEVSVNAAFYRVSGDYYKAKADYGNYYRHSLMFLACVDLNNDLDASQKISRARDLALAALLSSTTYNFGELLLHPILDSLHNADHDWIRNLLFAFNAGAIGKFESLVAELVQEPLLQQNIGFLREKICLMALIEAVFRRAAGARTLSFATIAEETRLPVGEVEHLIMKALSLKLIQGFIDQPASTVYVDWVQPRVLDSSQIANLGDRLSKWYAAIIGVERYTTTFVRGASSASVAA